jgi:hypothetical protein
VGARGAVSYGGSRFKTIDEASHGSNMSEAYSQAWVLPERIGAVGRKDWPGMVEASHTRIRSSASAGSKARIIPEAYLGATFLAYGRPV